MPKRALVLLLALIVPLSFVACGGGKDEDALLEEEATPAPARWWRSLQPTGERPERGLPALAPN